MKVTMDAARMLPPDSPVVPVTFAPTGHLVVVADHDLTPVEIREVEQRTSRPINLKVMSSDAVAHYQQRRLELPAEVRPIEAILSTAVELAASDIHVGVGTPPIVRIGSRVEPMQGWGPMTEADLDDVFAFIDSEVAQDPTWSGDKDLAMTFAERRMRVALYRQRGTKAASLRVLPSEIPPLESLGVPQSVSEFARLQDGLVLLVGATGSGKSTTNAAILDLINRTREGKLITIEDPIEYVHLSRRCLVHQREVGVDTESFFTGLRGALRQNPDFILVGEMRDRETMKIALEAAETGHLVFSTLHANSAPAAIDRIIDFFPSEEQNQVRTMLSSVLRGVIRQELLPDAKNPRKRHAACEVLVVNGAVANLIRKGDTEKIESQMQSGASEGMVTMDMQLAHLAAQEHISTEVALDRASNRALVEQHISRRWA